MNVTLTFATTYYVDAAKADNTGNGLTWATAKKDVQNAINLAASGDEVWVKAGTYKPTSEPDGTTDSQREYTFYLRDGVKLYGGFAGTETTLAGRPSSGAVTTLSGDIGAAGNNTDNTCHVVLCSAASSGGVGVTIDGFTISGGNANITGSVVVNGNAIVRNNGGGIIAVNGTNTINNNTFSGNSTSNFGGGIFIQSGTNTISNNTFSSNSTTVQGAGVYSSGGNNTINNNTFSGNTATQAGGGLAVVSGFATTSNNTFSTNSAADGGGIYTNSSSNTILNNTLSGNTSTKGGGVSISNGTNTISNNTFSANTATTQGGGFFTQFASNTFTNNILSGNTAGTYGGGVFIANGGNTITNNTFSGNTATTNGGGIGSLGGTNNIKNSIFWNNQQAGSSTIAGADVYNSGGTVTVTYSLTQQNSTYSSGTGIVNNQNPLFLNAADIDGADNIHRTADDGLILGCTSPAYNTGTNSGAPATDILGIARPQFTTADMGAYESIIALNTTPAAPTGTLAITNSTCVSGCTLSGGVIAIGTVSGGSGGTIQYSTNAGSTWSSSLPVYNQNGPAQTIVASVLNSSGCRSTSISVGTTVPGTACAVPAAPTITAGGPTTFCQGGSVTLTSSTATAYLWSSGQTTKAITASTSGSYVVTITGSNGCTNASTPTVVTASINTITLTSAVGTNAQSKCVTSAITNITYATTGATGATITGLPGGVTGSWAANVVTISGAPSTTVGSPFTYTITLTGGCGTVSTTGTITVTPQISYYPDTDLDGYGAGTATLSCTQPANTSTNNIDCNNNNNAINPGATEIPADGVDQDCNSQELCYKDADNDGYRPDATSTTTSVDLDCLDINEAVSTDPTGDCNDAVAAIRPGATEIIGDGVDQDCNGGEICFIDADNDGYRPDATTTIASFDADCLDLNEAVNTDPTGDCNDAAVDIQPGAIETAGDNVDQDCDGHELCYIDADDDGYIGYQQPNTFSSLDADCTDPYEATQTDPFGDCNDNVAVIRPGVAEIPGDGIDQDCNFAEICYADADNDGYRPNATSTVSSSDEDCSDAFEALGTDPTGDCNDASASLNPGVTEIPADGIDQDCSGSDLCYSAATLYVDASVAASGTGLAWATAMKTLDEALAFAHCCTNIDTVKVAAGTYMPARKPYNGCTQITTSDNRDRTFHLPDGLVLWGGYPAGGGTRNAAANVSILSGDIGTPNIVTDNCYHVVFAFAAASGGQGVIIDGFTITGGNANAGNSVTVNGNAIFQNIGGGIRIENGTNNISNNIISGNKTSFLGGGIYTNNGTNTISNNTLSGNTGIHGGGIYTNNGVNTISSNTFSSNVVSNQGGGISSQSGTIAISNNTFSGNTAGTGGGVFTSGGVATMSNNTLLGNSAGTGGGIYAVNSTSATISNNTLSGNAATSQGGGIYVQQGVNIITNNTLSGNTSNNNGGGISTQTGTNTITNNTLSGNTATNNGGGLYGFLSTNTVTNCIFWNNLKGGNSSVNGADISFNSGTNTVAYCLTQPYSDYSFGTGIVNSQDPHFINAADINGADNIYRTADDGLVLSCGSAAYNSGTNSGAPVMDILGNARPQFATADMGAYESMIEIVTPAPAGDLEITNSSCASACTVSGGAIALGTVSGSGVALEFSTDEGSTWSSALPTYSQVGPSNMIMASSLDAAGCRSAGTIVGYISPGVCVPPPTPTIEAGGPTTFCPGEYVVLYTNTANAYLWSTGEESQFIYASSGGSYTVTVTGNNGCTSVSDPIILTMAPSNTIALTSDIGTDAQTICVTSPITNITYATTGATDAIITGLPDGVTGTWAADVVTISGVPATTEGSPFTYNIFQIGGCANGVVSGTITVTEQGTYYTDTDGDGYGAGAAILSCTQPADTNTNEDDCDDTDNAVNPGATEICNAGVDDDCDGLSDNADEGVTGQNTYYADLDGDGYGAGPAILSCTQPANTNTNDDDCNDADNTVNPGATEICNTIDDDCDGQVDDNVTTCPVPTNLSVSNISTNSATVSWGGAACSISVWVYWGSSSVHVTVNSADLTNLQPNTTYTVTAMSDCGGSMSEMSEPVTFTTLSNVFTFYRDADGDTFGNPAITVEAATAPSGYVSDNTDCNDNNAAVRPNATEVCNLVDDNCNGQVDEGLGFTFYRDADNDTYGTPLVTITQCSATAPSGYRANSLDCNDASAAIKPGATEACNGIDDNCNGIVDDVTTCPTNVSKVASAITSTSATIGWSFRACATGYQYRYRTYTSATVFGPWIGSSDPDGWIATSDTSIVLTGLTPNTKYQYSMRNVCVNNFGTATAGKLFTSCTLLTFYQDLDNDGFGNSAVSQTLECVATLAGYKTVGGDCNDNVATIKPGAAEACNGIDDNCNSIVDDVTACPTNVSKVASNISSSTATVGWSFRACAYSYQYRYRQYTSTTVFGPWIGSSDPDGWISTNDTTIVLSGLTPNTKYQYSMRNVCYSNNGNATAGKLFTTCVRYTFYEDADGDGKGTATPTYIDCNATIPTGYVTNNLDCNDAEPLAWTGNTEVCGDDVDNDCDGNVDNAIFYADTDGDGFGDATMPLAGCPQPAGYSAFATDCNDADAMIKPGGAELCDNIDNDCDGIIDDVVTCPKPVANATTDITSSSATISWAALPCAVNGYEYRIRFQVGGVYGAYSAYIPVTTNSVNLTGLLPGTTYQYGVRTKCYGVNKYSVTTTAAAFTTLAGSALVSDISNETTAPAMEIETGYEVAIYPNPTTAKFITEITSDLGGDHIEIVVTDGFGRLLQQRSLVLTKGTNQQEIDLTTYPDAIYYIELRTDRGVVHYPVMKAGAE